MSTSLEAVRLLDAAGRGVHALRPSESRHALGMLWVLAGAAGGRVGVGPGLEQVPHVVGGHDEGREGFSTAVGIAAGTGSRLSAA